MGVWEVGFWEIETVTLVPSAGLGSVSRKNRYWPQAFTFAFLNHFKFKDEDIRRCIRI